MPLLPVIGVLSGDDDHVYSVSPVGLYSTRRFSTCQLGNDIFFAINTSAPLPRPFNVSNGTLMERFPLYGLICSMSLKPKEPFGESPAGMVPSIILCRSWAMPLLIVKAS